MDVTPRQSLTEWTAAQERPSSGERPEEFSVVNYSADLKSQWNEFVSRAKNSTFIFFREYMEYHRERFTDHSLMVFRGPEVVALLPANLRADGTLVSHEGLTYGGLLVPVDTNLTDVLSAFYWALRHLCEEGITSLIYKRIPEFYTLLPDDTVAYALFLVEAVLFRRDCAQVLSLPPILPFNKLRKRQIIKARHLQLRLVQESTFLRFWEEVLEPRLVARYGVKPVHSARDISSLANYFPANIKQFSVYDGLGILAGITIYETPLVAHAQYIAATDAGHESGALDYLLDWLIHDRYSNKRHFSLGTCNENEGRAVNSGLLAWQESFGATSYSHEFYHLSTLAFPRLEPIIQASPSRRRKRKHNFGRWNVGVASSDHVLKSAQESHQELQRTDDQQTLKQSRLRLLSLLVQRSERLEIDAMYGAIRTKLHAMTLNMDSSLQDIRELTHELSSLRR